MKKKYFILSIFLIIIDRIIKFIILNNFNLNNSINIINNFVKITYVKNYGGAFSILNGGRFLFIIIGFVAIIYIIKLIFEKGNSKSVSICYSCLMAGIIGNLIDRLFYGYVIDYIDLYFYNYNFFICNFADILIVFSSLFIIIYYLKRGDTDENICC